MSNFSISKKWTMNCYQMVGKLQVGPHCSYPKPSFYRSLRSPLDRIGQSWGQIRLKDGGKLELRSLSPCSSQHGPLAGWWSMDHLWIIYGYGWYRIYPLVSSFMASWKIPELNRGFNRKITYFYGPFFVASHVTDDTGGYDLKGREKLRRFFATVTSYIGLTISWNDMVHCNRTQS